MELPFTICYNFCFYTVFDWLYDWLVDCILIKVFHSIATYELIRLTLSNVYNVICQIMTSTSNNALKNAVKYDVEYWNVKRSTCVNIQKKHIDAGTKGGRIGNHTFKITFISQQAYIYKFFEEISWIIWNIVSIFQNRNFSMLEISSIT